MWASLNSGRSVVADARAALVTARDGGELLSSLSHELISLEDPAEGDRLLADRKGLPLTLSSSTESIEVRVTRLCPGALRQMRRHRREPLVQALFQQWQGPPAPQTAAARVGPMSLCGRGPC